MSKNFILYGFCSLGNFDNAQKILIQNIDNIDILYDNGVFFDFAIVKNDITFLKLLLKYAKEKQYSESEIVEILSKIPENNISLEFSAENKEINAEVRIKKITIRNILDFTISMLDCMLS